MSELGTFILIFVIGQIVGTVIKRMSKKQSANLSSGRKQTVKSSADKAIDDILTPKPKPKREMSNFEKMEKVKKERNFYNKFELDARNKASKQEVNEKMTFIAQAIGFKNKSHIKKLIFAYNEPKLSRQRNPIFVTKRDELGKMVPEASTVIATITMAYLARDEKILFHLYGGENAYAILDFINDLLIRRGYEIYEYQDLMYKFRSDCFDSNSPLYTDKHEILKEFSRDLNLRGLTLVNFECMFTKDNYTIVESRDYYKLVECCNKLRLKCLKV